MLYQKIKLGDYTANLYKTKLGYSYKIYYPLKGKSTCVSQSCVYFNERGVCYDKMQNDLKLTMGVIKTLFS